MTSVLERVEGIVPVRGHGRIDIMDERGKRVLDRVDFENFISQDTMLYQKFVARKIFWAGAPDTTVKRISVGSGSTDPGSGAYADDVDGGQARPEWWWSNNTAIHQDPHPVFMPRLLWVGTDAEAETPLTEYLIRGEVTAWASPVAYTGDDTRRGTVNPSECLFTPTMAKWVFDWPTTAGNGSFQSIGWGRVDTTAFGNSCRTAHQFGDDTALTNPTATQGLSSRPHRLDWDTANDRLIQNGTSVSRGTGIYATAPFTRYTTDKLFALPAGVGVATAIACDATGTPGVWCVHTSGSYLRKYDFTGVLISSATRTSSPLAGGAAIRSMAFDGNDLWAVAQSSPIVYRISRTTGEVLSQFDSGVTGVEHCAWFPGEGGQVVVGTSGGVGHAFTTTGVKKWMARETIPRPGDGSHNDMCIRPNDNDHEFIGANFYDTNRDYRLLWYARRFRSLGTRSLLGAPLSKTNLQTMKVTYQYDFA